LLVIDFGCIKEIPNEFYTPYFELADEKNLNKPAVFEEKLWELEILREDDTAQERKFFSKMFYDLLRLFTKPFNCEVFDFSDETFFQQIAQLGQQYAKINELRKMNTNRGSKHFIYINRTFFGLYNMMHELKANKVYTSRNKK